MSLILDPLLWLIAEVLELFLIVLIVRAVLSWLFAFDVVNARNQAAYQINDFVARLTEPVIRPVRRFVPNVGGIDLSFLVVFLLVLVLQRYINELRMVLSP
jgi:YggT family protein